MVKDAEAHASEDKKRRELVEARNQAESLVHSTEKSLKDYGDKVSAADKTAIETARRRSEGRLNRGQTPRRITAKTTAFVMQASMKLGEAMYKASQAEGAAEAPSLPLPTPTKTTSSMPTSRTSSDDKGDKKERLSALPPRFVRRQDGRA